MAAQRTCFHESDPRLALWRRAGVEGIGTFALVLAATGSGIAAARAFATLPGMILPVTAVAIAAALVGLIVALGSVSGGHYNPLITLLQWLGRERNGMCTIAYVAAQSLGGLLGGAAAAALWGGPSGPASGLAGGLGWPGLGGELVASAGLMLVVFGCMRSGRTDTGPFAVGAWLVADIIATPTAAYANPAVVFGALVTTGPLHLAPASAAPYLLGEGLGALLAFGLVCTLFPRPRAA
jgi:glycerol uptake facilitator-like aquaporin